MPATKLTRKQRSEMVGAAVRKALKKHPGFLEKNQQMLQKLRRLSGLPE